MELLQKTLDAIIPADKDAKRQAQERLDKLVKPIGSLGKLEDIAVKLAGITGKINNKFDRKCTVIMCADNGVTEEGVSSCPQDITRLQTLNFLKGITGIAVLSKHAKADIKVVDIGINADVEHNEIVNKKIRRGTSNMAKGPAMTREEAIKAIEAGIEVTQELIEQGYSLIGTGEMGIGNTSTSSAVLMAYTGFNADFAVGKGAGLTDDDYDKKKFTILKALELNKPNPKDPVDVVSKVGGFDICGMAGCFLGAASKRTPVVIDGFISAAAAMTAYKLNPNAIDYMIPSHYSAEPGYRLIMKELGLEPLLNLNMRLGEGSGCPLAFNIIDAASEIISNMGTFEEALISSDCMVDIR